MERPVSRSLAIGASILSPVLSSFAWITEGEAILALGPLTVSAYSLLLGGMALLVIARMRGSLPSREALLRHRKDLLLICLTRNIGAQLTLAYALLYTASSKVMFLTKIEPYLVVFWFWLLGRERVSRSQLGLLAIHVGGAVLLSTGGKLQIEFEQIGDLLICIGIAVNALSYSPAQSLTHALGSLAVPGITAFAAGAALVPCAFFLEPNPFVVTDGHMYGWYNVLVTVLIFYVAATFLWYYSLRGMKAWLASALRCVGPVVAAPVAWLMYDQPLSAAQVIGGAIVLLTSVLMIKERREPAVS